MTVLLILFGKCLMLYCLRNRVQCKGQLDITNPQTARKENVITSTCITIFLTTTTVSKLNLELRALSQVVRETESKANHSLPSVSPSFVFWLSS